MDCSGELLSLPAGHAQHPRKIKKRMPSLQADTGTGVQLGILCGQARGGGRAEAGGGQGLRAPWKLSGIRGANPLHERRPSCPAGSSSLHLRGTRHPIGLVCLWRGRGAPIFPLCSGQSRGDNRKACGGHPKWNRSSEFSLRAGGVRAGPLVRPGSGVVTEDRTLNKCGAWGAARDPGSRLPERPPCAGCAPAGSGL